MSKKSTTEWIIIAGFAGLLISAIGFSSYVVYRIQEEGGIKQSIINAGKEVKDIARQIN